MQIGNYEIEHLIGEGAFGRTFKGVHRIIGVPVCIKQEKTGKDPFRGLFREEARVIAKLRHPSLPSYIDYFELPSPIGQVLLISYIDGQPLDKLVQTKVTDENKVIASRPIDDEHICWITDRILGAVAYLHGKHRVIHCDLKPGNVIMEVSDHNANVVDLGMAAVNPVEFTKAKGGTTGYLPPEFDIGLPPIPASDIYSIGKIVCFIAGGDVIQGVFPTDMHPELREFFETWIRHDPLQRPNNAEKLRTELTSLRRKVFKRSTCREEFKFRYENGHKGEKS